MDEREMVPVDVALFVCGSMAVAGAGRKGC
jgi:hypothetical protein